MPPRAKITKDMVVDAALAVLRRDGYERLNARTAAAELGCSTQPVMSQFPAVEELRRAAYARADGLHTDYLLRAGSGEDPLLGIGLNYIRFAVEEPQLFRFLFQSGYAAEKSLPEMLDSPALTPILAAIGEEAGLDETGAREVFRTLALFVHGYASILANNSMPFDEKQAADQLERVFLGAVMAAGQEETT